MKPCSSRAGRMAVYQSEVVVDPGKCVSCGICVGSCPSSTPFRRSGRTGGQDRSAGLSLRANAEDTIAACAALSESPASSQ